MPKYYETDEFRELSKKWKKKLELSGFEDQEETIEQKDDAYAGPRLKSWSSSFFRGRFNAEQYQAKVDYFRIAGQFLFEHVFDNEVQKTVWKHHCDGHSYKKIEALLGANDGVARRNIEKVAKIMMEKKRGGESEE